MAAGAVVLWKRAIPFPAPAEGSDRDREDSGYGGCGDVICPELAGFENAILSVFYPGHRRDEAAFAVQFQFYAPGFITLTAKVDEQAFAAAVLEPEDRDMFLKTHVYQEVRRSYHTPKGKGKGKGKGTGTGTGTGTGKGTAEGKGGAGGAGSTGGAEPPAEPSAHSTAKEGPARPAEEPEAGQPTKLKRLQHDVLFPRVDCAAQGQPPEDPEFYAWMVDSQERPAFGTHEGRPTTKPAQRLALVQTHADLPPRGFSRRFGHVMTVLTDAGVSLEKCCVHYNSPVWMRKKGFHLKCFIHPTDYFANFVAKAGLPTDVQAALRQDGEECPELYLSRYHKDSFGDKARPIFDSLQGAPPVHPPHCAADQGAAVETVETVAAQLKTYLEQNGSGYISSVKLGDFYSLFPAAKAVMKKLKLKKFVSRFEDEFVWQTMDGQPSVVLKSKLALANH